MRYLICYDIADDRRRKKVSALLEEDAFRIQESVFVGEFTAQELKKIKASLKKLAHVDGEKEAVDSVHIYPLCDACWKKVWQIGSGTGLERVIIV
ncbi:MAG: CRISPR-associated endonuclease Cas2 [Anaerovibrio sp.]